METEENKSRPELTNLLKSIFNLGDIWYYSQKKNPLPCTVYTAGDNDWHKVIENIAAIFVF